MATTLAESFDGFLIDLDGVVWEGRDPIPRAVESLNALSDAGKEIVFVTNNSVRAPDAYAKRLRGIGVAVADGRVVTAGAATAQLAAEEAAGGTAFVIGAPGFKELVAAAGLELLEGEEGRRADAVVVSGHREFDYAELLTATFALREGAKLFATSRDPTLPMPGGAWPGTGATLAAVETASGKRAEIGGKPESHLFDAALNTLRCSFAAYREAKEQRNELRDDKRMAMVGDRVASDIEGGRRAGLGTILVLSGATSREEAEVADPAPDHVIDDLAGLLA
jgi:HAD superfamily hydrolase (TIGR01450 family)